MIHSRSLVFILYINDLPKVVKNTSKPILIADDTSVVFTNCDPTDFISDITTVFKCLHK
jgi:hypothetical protein